MTNGDQLYKQGLQAAKQGDMAGALSLLEQATLILPARGDIAYNYGVILQQTGKLDRAITAWKSAVATSPEHAVIWGNLALGLMRRGLLDEAQTTYEQALTLHSESRDLLYPYALLLNKRGAYAQSLAVFDALLTRHPHDQATLINAGKTAKALGLFDRAEALYQQALDANGPHTPLAHFNRANLLLLQGKWHEGFDAYEWRLKLPDMPPAPWGLPAFHNDMPKGSRILVWSDQGLGDALMFFRFLPALAAQGYELYLFAQTPLKPLFKGHPFINDVFDPHDAPAPMDAALPIGSLPKILGAQPESSWAAPYMTAPPLSILPPRTDSNRRIGLVWAGNPKHENDAARSLPLRAFAPLLDTPGTSWYSLQLGATPQDIEAAGLSDKLCNLAPQITDFAASAAILRELDLLISVDTAAAHLAGAMGKPVWTLLPAQNGDWRWGTSGATSFWYPSMRLYRQDAADQGQAAIEKMGKDLQIMSL